MGNLYLHNGNRIDLGGMLLLSNKMLVEILPMQLTVLSDAGLGRNKITTLLMSSGSAPRLMCVPVCQCKLPTGF